MARGFVREPLALAAGLDLDRSGITRDIHGLGWSDDISIAFDCSATLELANSLAFATLVPGIFP